MTWNYRAIRYADGTVGLHEVYYDAAGVPEGWTEGACGFVGDDVDELRRVLVRALLDLGRPVLDDIPDDCWTLTAAGEAMLKAAE